MKSAFAINTSLLVCPRGNRKVSCYLHVGIALDEPIETSADGSRPTTRYDLCWASISAGSGLIVRLKVFSMAHLSVATMVALLSKRGGEGGGQVQVEPPIFRLTAACLPPPRARPALPSASRIFWALLLAVWLLLSTVSIIDTVASTLCFTLERGTSYM